MKIEVGTTLKWHGRDVICSSTRHDHETKFAHESSVEMRASLAELLNCQFMAVEMDLFEVGDVVDIEYQRVELQVPGRHIFYLYPYYKVKRMGDDGHKQTRTDEMGSSGVGSSADNSISPDSAKTEASSYKVAVGAA